MRVAIDTGPLSSGHAVRGIGVNTKELIDAIGDLHVKNPKVEAVDFASTDLSKYDIVHYQFFRPFFIDLPFTKPARKVVLTIHDLIPLLYPKHYSPGIKGSIRYAINKFLVKKNVDAVITISEASKKGICRFLGIPPQKVHVTYLAPKKLYRKMDAGSPKNVKDKFKLPDKFVFYMGDVNYNKNIPTLIKACKILEIPLVMGGRRAARVENVDLNHIENRHIKEIYDDLTNPDTVIRVGFVSDEEARAIYNLASVYVQPSFSEGFGLPVLEAFACETPVVAAETPALTEIGQAGALFANPNDTNDFVEKIKQVLDDKSLRNQLIESAKIVVKNYTWEKTAKETLKVYESL